MLSEMQAKMPRIIEEEGGREGGREIERGRATEREERDLGGDEASAGLIKGTGKDAGLRLERARLYARQLCVEVVSCLPVLVCAFEVSF